MVLAPVEAAKAIRSGQALGPVQVPGRLDLSNFEGDTLPPGLHCYELDARGSQLVRLPDDFCIDGRLVLDNCPRLRSLPDGLTAGSISLRNCPSVQTLPEKLSTWFLDMTGCTQFEAWPKSATIHNGSLILRNCVRMHVLPSWIGRVAHLDLAGCPAVREIPEGISVSGWVDIGGTGISRLPSSMQAASLRWRSVPINERIAFHPEQLTAKEALGEKNAEVRRVIIERMGYLRFSQEAHAQILDEDSDSGGTRQLLLIDLQQDEPLVGLSCCCPSTGRQYFLRVPPQIKTCHHAAAWMAGFDDPSLYRPQIET